MKVVASYVVAVLTLLHIAFGQDQVRVICNQDSMVAKIQKAIVLRSGYTADGIHLNDKACMFYDDPTDLEFFVRNITPLTDCLTSLTVNETHAEFRNTITTGPVQTGDTYPHGVIVGNADMAGETMNVLTSVIACTYKIDIRVSTAFLPNISMVVIPIPDVYELGVFNVAMYLFTDASYRTAYAVPPVLQPADTLYVGINIVEEASPDIYLVIEHCWGTVYEDPNAVPRYNLITNGCAVAASGDGRISVTQNGVGHQSLWNGPVFKFVGDGEAYNTVWLHCDLQICINSNCEPTCPAKRRRRREIFSEIKNPAISDFYKGPDDQSVIISMKIPAPLVQSAEADIAKGDMFSEFGRPSAGVLFPKKTPDGEEPEPQESGFGVYLVPTVVGVVGSLALIGVILVLMIVFMKLRTSSRNKGMNLSGTPNAAFAT